MQEMRVTVAGKNHTISEPFFVLATQNPIEQEGTYALPEAQLDRFMFIIRMDYPNREDEISIAKRTTIGNLPKIQKLMSGKKLKEFQSLVEKILFPIMFMNSRLIWFVRPDRIQKKPQFGLKNPGLWGAGPWAVQFLIKRSKKPMRL